MGYTALVTGANRGIGLGLVKQLASKSEIDVVFAATRNPEATAFEQLNRQFNGKVVPIEMEVVDEASVAVMFPRYRNSNHPGCCTPGRSYFGYPRPRHPCQ